MVYIQVNFFLNFIEQMSRLKTAVPFVYRFVGPVVEAPFRQRIVGQLQELFGRNLFAFAELFYHINIAADEFLEHVGTEVFGR